MTRTKHARGTDPQTSLDAALAATTPSTKLRASQARVLNMFKLYGDMNDKDLLDRLNDAERSIGLRPMSPSGARSRRSELSKPNMDRLDRIAIEMGKERDMAWPIGRAFGGTRAIHCYDDLSDDPNFSDPTTGTNLSKATAVKRLRAEGFKSPLWDTGKRETVDGRQVIVWGLAV